MIAFFRDLVDFIKYYIFLVLLSHIILINIIIFLLTDRAQVNSFLRWFQRYRSRVLDPFWKLWRSSFVFSETWSWPKVSEGIYIGIFGSGWRSLLQEVIVWKVAAELSSETTLVLQTVWPTFLTIMIYFLAKVDRGRKETKRAIINFCSFTKKALTPGPEN